MSSFVETTEEGGLRLHFHPGQWRAWESAARVVAVLAGAQSGKTSFGPHWLYREIALRGPGDYLVVTPTFTLLELKALPEFLTLFSGLLGVGKYRSSPVRCFEFSPEGSFRTFGRETKEPTKIFFGYAADPDSLESATAKAAWLDEAGQRRFKLSSWEAIQRRLSVHQGRVLITTTPYDLGWLKAKIHDPWAKAVATGEPCEIDLIRFDSTENPAFPPEEMERARNSLPRWKFDLFYRAIFTRPAGMIYDCHDEEKHVVPDFKIPERWERYLGLDFGGVNTAGIFFAEEPTSKTLYAYREYHAGSRTASEHTDALLAGEPMIPFAVGGAGSEDQWRAEFRKAGLPVREPSVKDVEVGIDRVYGAIKRGEVRWFASLEGILGELLSYSRVLDDSGEPTEAIEDKAKYHRLDAVRYILGKIRPGEGPSIREISVGVSDLDRLPSGVFG